MKKVIIYTMFAVLVAGLASCSKPSADRVEPLSGDGELEIVFEGFEDGTKAGGLEKVELDLDGDYNPKSQVVTAKLRYKDGEFILQPGTFTWMTEQSREITTCTPIGSDNRQAILTATAIGEGFLKANITYKGQYVESAALPVIVTKRELTRIHIEAIAPKSDYFDGDFDDSDGIKTVPTSKFWENKVNRSGAYIRPHLLEFDVVREYVEEEEYYEKKIKWTLPDADYADETYSATVGDKTLEVSIPTLSNPRFEEYGSSLTNSYAFRVSIPKYTEEHRFETISAGSIYPEFSHVPYPWSYGDTYLKTKNLIGTHTIKAKYGNFECEKTFEVIPEIGEYGTTAGTGGVGYYYYFVFDRIGRNSIFDAKVQILERIVVQNGGSITLPSFPYSTAKNPDYWHVTIAGSATCTSEPTNLNNVKIESEYQVFADRAPVNNDSMFLNRRKTYGSSSPGGTQYASCFLRSKGANLSVPSGNYYKFFDFNYDYFHMPGPEYDHANITQGLEYIPPIHYENNFPKGDYVLEVYYYNKVILSCNVKIQ